MDEKIANSIALHQATINELKDIKIILDSEYIVPKDVNGNIIFFTSKFLNATIEKNVKIV